MIESLIKMMVSVTYYTNDEITLKEELELLDCYIYIQKMRFMNFEVKYEIADELLEYKVNKLVLQPFVENSILYAFKEKEDMGIITIRADKKDDCLEIEVQDNGSGFDLQRIEQSHNENKRRDHVGIKNVSERIRLNYGEKYGIRIESSADSGTIISIRLPLIKD